jgi:hypothetical protein
MRAGTREARGTVPNSPVFSRYTALSDARRRLRFLRSAPPLGSARSAPIAAAAARCRNLTRQRTAGTPESTAGVSSYSGAFAVPGGRWSFDVLNRQRPAGSFGPRAPRTVAPSARSQRSSFHSSGCMAGVRPSGATAGDRRLPRSVEYRRQPLTCRTTVRNARLAVACSYHRYCASSCRPRRTSHICIARIEQAARPTTNNQTESPTRPMKPPIRRSCSTCRGCNRATMRLSDGRTVPARCLTRWQHIMRRDNVRSHQVVTVRRSLEGSMQWRLKTCPYVG